MCARVRQSATAGKIRIPGLRTLRLCGESLEPRRLLAGDVSVSVIRGTLYLTGDNRDNVVELRGTITPNQYIVQGFADSQNVNTSINRQSGPLTFNNVTNISVSLRGGADFFSIESANVAGNVNIDMGDGNDVVNSGVGHFVTATLSSSTAKAAFVPVARPAVPEPALAPAVTIAGSLCVNLGSGNNSLLEQWTHVQGSESIDSCDGNDTVELLDANGPQGAQTIGRGVVIDHDLCVNLGGGTNSLDAYDLRVGGQNLKVNGSGTNDVELAVLNVAKDAVFNLCGRGCQDFSIAPEVELGTPTTSQQNHIGGNLLVTTGNGNDRVTEVSLEVLGSNKISTGNGNDSVILGVVGDTPDNEEFLVSIAKDLYIDLGCGQDSLTATNVRPNGTATITQSGGGTDVNLTNFFTNALKITTGGGKDNVTLQFVIASTAQVLLGAGNDSLKVANTTITTSTFDGGSGVNTYTDGGANSLINLTKKHFT